MAINRTSPKKGKVVDIPSTPTVGTATAGPASATVAYTAATVGGPATTFTALSNPGSITGTGTSPITVSGLTEGTAYTFTVRGSNATGSGEYSSASNSVTPTANTSYESIATTTVGAGGSGAITFSSIPSTYKHLQIRGFGRLTTASSGASNIGVRFNSDTGTNYSYHILSGNGSTTNAGGAGTANQMYLPDMIIRDGSAANVYSGFVIDILEYANTNINKTVRALSGYDTNGSGKIALTSGSWRNTAAVTSITLVQESDSYKQYSSFALYGIKG
jgi:hypothetical protein